LLGSFFFAAIKKKMKKIEKLKKIGKKKTFTPIFSHPEEGEKKI